MDFRILGPLEVVGDTGPVALPRGRGRSLLALLVLRAGEVVPSERLIDELWGQTPPPTASKGLHNLISDLRRRLDSGGDRGALATSGPGYMLQIRDDEVDANRFRRLVEEDSRAPAEERAVRLREALGLWRGPALADVAYEPFAQTEIAVLEELRLTAVEERVDADLMLGRHAVLVAELERLVAEHPYRERLRAQLMLSLYRCGRQVDALDVHNAGRRALVEELGVEPGPALTRLERAILNQDPSLDMAAQLTVGTVPADQDEAWLAEERKTVTVMYADLAESTTSAGDADPELLRRLLARCVEAARTIVTRHGGTVEGFIGGVVVAIFGVPSAREDDAQRAAAAGIELRDAVAALSAAPGPAQDVNLIARIGINTGEVVVADTASGPAAASGDAVKLAARLQQAAGGGDVLIGEATRQLLGDAARVESVAALVLDRRGRPATVWRLAALTPGAHARPVDRSRPLVGRGAELARLHAAFQQTLRQRRACLFFVVGEAGVGKSRLGLEFVATLAADVKVLWCRCPAYGEGDSLWPLRALVQEAVGDAGPPAITALLSEDDDAAAVAAQIAGAIGLQDQPESGRELFPAVRRLLEALAARGPVSVVVDDAHWAQPRFLDLLGYLAESVQAPLLIVCLARPELLDQDPAGPVGASEPPSPGRPLVLGPLPPNDSERLVTDLLAGRLVPDDAVSQIVEMAQGNPLFIEQLLAALRDEGKVRFPPSVHALLAARLDRLGPAERDLLRCASVAGDEFSLEALTAMVPQVPGRFLGRHVDALQRKELIRPSVRPFPGGRTYAFRHALIQQAAYRSATRQTRAELHERLADWLEYQHVPEREEMVGYHLEQAHVHRRQLGIDDEATRDLGLRAGLQLAQAGLRAYRLFDMTAAENLLARARTLLPSGHPQRYEVLRRLAEAYPTLGRLTDAEAVLAEMLEDPRTRDDPRLMQRLRLEQLRVRVIAGPDPVRHDTIRAEVMQAMTALGPSDEVGLSQACYVLATIHLRAGRIRELEDIGRRGLEHARRSGDLRELMGALWWPSWALVVGPTPVPDAIASGEALLRAAGASHIGVVTDVARLKAMLGEFDVARDLVLRAREQVVERVRVRRALTVLALRGAEVETLAGDLDAAERTLRPALAVALDVGERDQTSQIAAELSLVLSARGCAVDAARFASVSRQQAPAECVSAQALWRAATARALARAGDTGEAVLLAREAITLVPASMLNLRAGLQVELARALLAAGEHQAMASAIREAAVLYERKGNVVGARRARTFQEP
jgi:DNA-binding SARP family transcriptional activator/tetratricopeptide (TPR) repeat protein